MVVSLPIVDVHTHTHMAHEEINTSIQCFIRLERRIPVAMTPSKTNKQFVIDKPYCHLHGTFKLFALWNRKMEVNTLSLSRKYSQKPQHSLIRLRPYCCNNFNYLLFSPGARSDGWRSTRSERGKFSVFGDSKKVDLIRVWQNVIHGTAVLIFLANFTHLETSKQMIWTCSNRYMKWM